MVDKTHPDQLPERAWLESLGVELRDETDPDLAAELARPAGALRVPVASFGRLAMPDGVADLSVIEAGLLVAVIGVFGDHQQFHTDRDTALSHFRLFRQPPLPSACYLMSAVLVSGPQRPLYLVGAIELRETEGAVTRVPDLGQTLPPNVAALAQALGLPARTR